MASWELKRKDESLQCLYDEQLIRTQALFTEETNVRFILIFSASVYSTPSFLVWIPKELVSFIWQKFVSPLTVDLHRVLYVDLENRIHPSEVKFEINHGIREKRLVHWSENRHDGKTK